MAVVMAAAVESRQPFTGGSNSRFSGSCDLEGVLKYKLLSFRDVLDLPQQNGSAGLSELILCTLEDLQQLYPNCIKHPQNHEADQEPQVLFCFYKALMSLSKLWAKNSKKLKLISEQVDLELLSSEQLGQQVLKILDRLSSEAREMSNSVSDNDNKLIDAPLTPTSVLPESSQCYPIHEGFTSIFHPPPFLRPLRTVKTELNPHSMQHTNMVSGEEDLHSATLPENHDDRDDDGTKRHFETISPVSSSVSLPKLLLREPIVLSPTPTPSSSPMTPSFLHTQFSMPLTHLQEAYFSNDHDDENVQIEATLSASTQAFILKGSGSAPPPPPPPPPSKGFVSAPLPLLKGSASPPPPPFVAAKALRTITKKANSKLKRSTQMGKLYRLLKGRVEGSNPTGKSSWEKSHQIGGVSNGNKGLGMADALAEMTKRSAYFRQIEEDVEKHASMILELKSAMESFRSKNMNELINFHKHVESQLEKLNDETQVLARFEGFPYKKLENIRLAAALFLKLTTIEANLKNWKMLTPVMQQLDKVESYFSKLKEEVDTIERTKDEDSKQFESHNIEFDFSILLKIKELMVDLSSNCIEMALKESREAKHVNDGIRPTPNGHAKMLWRAFQLAFRVYNFAGGQDDRADRLTTAIAKEIETSPQT